MTDAAEKPTTAIERLKSIEEVDLQDLCDATEAAIRDGNGFGWLAVPRRSVLEAYWKGVVLMPERELFVAWLNGRIVGSTQLLRPSRHNEAQAHIARLSTFFIAPGARGLGLARGLLRMAEDVAREQGFLQIDLDVRATQKAAIQIYEQAGYVRWGTQRNYAVVDQKQVPGYYYSRALVPAGSER
ncbi:MAG: GNAT family N-acetyltransferase [Pseudomonadota bacterium]|nr:GNAT family N-acetyltransferase [Pseudomonadota bacterium]